MKKALQSIIVILSLVGVVSVAVPPLPAYAACDKYILTFPAWYNGLTTGTGNDCVLVTPKQDARGVSVQRFIVKIILNIINILMQLVAYTSIVFLIVGGFRYLVSTGRPDKITMAVKTISHAIFGLIIGMLAVAIVNLVGASL